MPKYVNLNRNNNLNHISSNYNDVGLMITYTDDAYFNRIARLSSTFDLPVNKRYRYLSELSEIVIRDTKGNFVILEVKNVKQNSVSYSCPFSSQELGDLYGTNGYVFVEVTPFPIPSSLNKRNIKQVVSLFPNCTLNKFFSNQNHHQRCVACYYI